MIGMMKLNMAMIQPLGTTENAWPAAKKKSVGVVLEEKKFLRSPQPDTGPYNQKLMHEETGKWIKK